MAKLSWDDTGKRFYETGVDRGVLFVMGTDGTYGKGVVWNGLTTVTESPSGAEENALYADNTKYLSLRSNEEFGATIEAYTYPDEWMACDGEVELTTGVVMAQQTRSKFALCYRSKIGNDVNDDLGYKIHIIYNASASPSEKSRQTVNDSPEAVTFSWEVTTTPISVSGHKPTSHITIDSTKVTETKLAALEDYLYGTDSEESACPDPAKIIELLA